MKTLELTEEQIHGRACRTCASPAPPLHPDETITTRVDEGVVRDTVTVLCTSCLGRTYWGYTAIRQPRKLKDGSTIPGLWAIRDSDGEFVMFESEDGPELLVFGTLDGVVGWVSRHRYLTAADRPPHDPSLVSGTGR